MNAGDVAGGGDDAALAAADDDRLVGKLRIVALLDRRIEGVAIDMGERQVDRVRLMPDEARAAAGRATARFAFLLGKAVATEAGCLVRRWRHRGENKD